MQRGAAGELSLREYIAFLSQAYHHVKHTVPLLMACGGRLPADYEWLRAAVAEYIEEELGHQEWILNDIRACGGDSEGVRHSAPAPATELMVAYAIQATLALPSKAFSYLKSHGALDVSHVEFFKDLMNRIYKPEDQAEIIRSAKMFYRLYGNIFRELGNIAPLANAA